jgi:hypothetical protein
MNSCRSANSSKVREECLARDEPVVAVVVELLAPHLISNLEL